ncbi:hypothetical protein KUTeg_000163 [Tegillarca granosa]|uniref:Uncharacterized protein n=1 Tax=Tegillarca granosa TaxID=220873 RepID=A0ABQ9FXX8_TEGGR|nr:hypothetical protein KUTeg_000163 [Tegillarca granosa]
MVQVGMSDEEGTFYVGSRIFQSIADAFGLPIDQFNFLACMLFGLGFGFYFRDALSPRRTSVVNRHIIDQLWHLVALSTVCYAVMMFGPRHLIHKIVFVISMGYVCTLHIYRQYYDYGGYTLDVTGPMMIMVQKTTSIAFALHDGESVPEEKLSTDQKSQMLNYMFCFHGIMVGPTSFYNDYIKFIEGTDYQEVNNKGRKQLSSTDDFINNTTLIYRMCYVLLCITLVRGKYYFAWKLGETVNNAAGFGFNGYDKDGEPKWDLLNNVDIYLLETCTSLKVNIDCWNKLTIVWLRRVVYDRVPKYHTLFVFSVSCIWHGFYPGYYICFGTALLLTMAARQIWRQIWRQVRPYLLSSCTSVRQLILNIWRQIWRQIRRQIRRQVRPYFLSSPQLKLFYDCVTFLFTRFANVYITSSHDVIRKGVLMIYRQIIKIDNYHKYSLYTSQYFYLHILSVAALVILNFVKPARQQKSTEKKTQKSKI